MQELCLLSEQLENSPLLLLGKVEIDNVKSLSTRATQRSTFFAKGKRMFQQFNSAFSLVSLVVFFGERLVRSSDSFYTYYWGRGCRKNDSELTSSSLGKRSAFCGVSDN